MVATLRVITRVNATPVTKATGSTGSLTMLTAMGPALSPIGLSRAKPAALSLMVLMLRLRLFTMAGNGAAKTNAIKVSVKVASDGTVGPATSVKNRPSTNATTSANNA